MVASPDAGTTAKKRILIFCDYYPPSTTGGGGTWSVVNLIERFCDRYDFYVVTRNHDSRTDRRPFESVKSNAWNDVGKAKINYLSPSRIGVASIVKLVLQVSPEVVFLNSVFSRPVVTFLRCRKKLRSLKIPVILAPCGELSEGALSLKPLKKRIFLFFAKSFGLYSDICWKATSTIESDEIRRIFGKELDPKVAPDLPPKEILSNFSFQEKPDKYPGKVKIIYYSRIDRKKNLMFLLDVFSQMNSDRFIEFTIAGPIGDRAYWNECLKRITRLPASICVNIVGPISYHDGLKHLVANHFFVLPTLGENFGYVIVEALSAACPVIISDRTIWEVISEMNAGRTIPLDARNRWIENIDACVGMGQDQFSLMSRNARQIAVKLLGSPDIELATEQLLTEVMGV